MAAPEYDLDSDETVWEQTPPPRQHDRRPGVRVKPVEPPKRSRDQIFDLLFARGDDGELVVRGGERQKLLDELRSLR